MNFYPWGKAWRQAGSTYWHVFGGMGFENINNVSPTPNRDYAEALGRWLSPDPMGGDIMNPQSLNRYAYALNNPVSNNDPSGLSGCAADDASTVDTGGGTGVIHVTSWAPCPGPDNVGVLPPQASENSMPGGGGGGGGGAQSPPSWWGTFAKSFVTNFHSTTWNSLTSSKGCVNQFVSNTLSNLNPFIPSASSFAEPTANFVAAVKFNSALAYAASRTNVLGGTGLLYPFNSSVFRGMLSASQEALEAVPVLQLVGAEGQALYMEGKTAFAGECN